MKKRAQYQLILESLEERVFFDANPVAAIVEPSDGGVEDITPDGAQMQADNEAVTAAQEDDGADTAAEQAENDSQEEQLAEELADGESAGEEEDAGSADALLEGGQTGEESDEDGSTDTEMTDQDQNVLVEQDVVDKSGVDRVVFVDDNIDDFDSLLEGVATDVSQLDESFNIDGLLEAGSQVVGNTEIVVLDHESDELDQISESLADYDELNSVHIYSYGSQNSLSLGDTTLTTANLESYSTQISEWGEALSEDGDFLLYGCNIAGDVTENNFVEDFAQLTGADVAASDDQTGNQASGGDWDLEVTSGEVEATTLHDAAGQWEGVLDPAADSSLSADNTEPMINSTFNFDVTFDNTDAADVGYGPFLDVVVPAAVDIIGDPSYLGQSVDYTVYTWDADAGAWLDASNEEVTVHPFDDSSTSASPLDLPVGTTDGDEWYLVELPFGSFTPDQPAATVTFEATTSDSAEVGVDIDITSQAGFRFGDTATNDNGPIQEAAAETLTITPQVIDIEKSDDLSEAQTVTGPNYPVTYTLTVNVAADETVGDVIVQDYLPENAVYRGDVSITAINGAAAFTGTITEPDEFEVLGDTADRLLTINFGDTTGVSGSNGGTAEYEITYTVYFSDLQSDGDDLLPGTGDDVDNVLNESSVTGTYGVETVSDGIDDGVDMDVLNGNDNDTLSDNEIEIASLVTYKSVEVVSGNDPAPYETLEWTIEVDISDYYTADNIVLTDIFGDGQTFDTSVAPTLVVSENGTTTSYTFDSANYTLGTESAYNDEGDTELIFYVSTLLGGDGSLAGGFVDELTASADEDGDPLNDRSGTDATKFFIVYQTTIDHDYDKFHTEDTSSGDKSVDIGDAIQNQVTVSADITDGTDTEEQDDFSENSVVIPGGSVEKTIYAVNGDTAYDISDGVQVGDEVTYRLTMTLPSADFEHLVVTDYLPLPVYDADELTSITTDDFLTDNAGTASEVGVVTYTGGEITFGPNHNLSSSYITGLSDDEGTTLVTEFQDPVVTVDGDNNSITLDFGSYDATGSEDAVIDILLTVTINNEPMADLLQLTNQGEWSINDTYQTPDTEVEIQQVHINAPEVEIIKGVVGIDNTSVTLDADAQGPLIFNADGTIDLSSGIVDAAALIADPVDADLTGADGGDVVTFALTIYNTGGDDAYDINVTDTLPTGFVTPTDISDLNLRVYQGSSDVEIDSTLYEASLVDTSLDGTADTLTVNFEDVVLTGDIDRDSGDGTDVFIVTYQLTVDNETAADTDIVTAGSTHTNTATVDFFTGVDDSDIDRTEVLGEPTDDAAVTIAEPTVDKTLISTEIVDTTNSNTEAVIGELVTYQVEVTLPEGLTENAVLKDTLDSGLTFNELLSVTSTSTDLSTSIGDSSFTATNSTNFTATTNGNLLTIDLGDITNSNDNNTAAETVTIVYTAYVNNDSANQSTTTLNNSAQLTFTGGDGESNTDSADDVTVIEPELEVDKSVVVNGVDDNSSGDAGDTVVYTITIQHTTDSETTAYDVDFSDQIPDEIQIDTSTAWLTVDDQGTGGGAVTADDFTLDGNLLTLNDTIDMLEDRVITLTVTGTLVADVAPDEIITNEAEVTWQSLDGDDDNERTGDDGPGGLNDYSDSDDADVTIAAPTVEKTLVSTGIIDGTNLIDEAVIGELVTYQVVVTLPEGVTEGAVLKDTLPDGLTFNALLSVTPSSDLSSSLNFTDLANFTASISENTLSIDLGNITNTNADDSVDDTVTIVYTAYVNNDVDSLNGEALNESTDTLSNSAQLTYTRGDTGEEGASDIDSAETVTVIEPELEVSKDVEVNGVAGNTSGDAGDTVVYTIVIQHSDDSETTAYDVDFSDQIPDEIQIDTSTVWLTVDDQGTGGGAVTAGDFTLDGNLLTLNDTIDMLEDRVITLTVTGTLVADVVPDEIITNEAEITWQSLDGDNDNERTGEGDGANDYSASDDADIDIFDVGITKTLIDTGISEDGGASDNANDQDTLNERLEATIGETVTYEVVLTIPEGELSSAQLVDVLDEGLQFDQIVSTTFSSGLVRTDPVTSSTSGQEITFDFGTITNTNDDNTAEETITIRYTAIVLDDAVNVNGRSDVDNAAHLVWNTDSGTDSSVTVDAEDLTIIEPQITTTKSVVDKDAGGADTEADELNDIMTYTVVMTNTGSGTAYEVSLSDTLALGTELVENSISISTTSSTAETNLNLITFTNTDGLLTFSDDSWDLAVDEKITIEYDVRVIEAWFVGGDHINTADADWSSLDGTDADERIYDDSDTRNPGMSQDGTQDTATATFTVPLGDGTIGDTVWLDVNDNGIQDTGEAGIPGVAVTAQVISPLDGTTVYDVTAITDNSGQYLFTHLPDATYVVQVDSSTLPAGVSQTYDYAVDQNTNVLDHTGTHTITDSAGGETFLDVDFGYTGTGTIGDYVWYDTDQDGIQDEVGLGIEGATVTLHGDLDGDGTYEYTDTATTDENGLYQFTNLPLENYWVEVSSSPIGLSNETYERDGSLDNRVDIAAADWDSNDPSIQDLDFGFVDTGSIGNYIWNNLNGDSVQDAGESGLANVTVTLTGDLDKDGILETLTTVTDADGLYLFENLPTGDFTITVDETTLPESFVITSDPDATRDSTSTVTLGVGEDNDSQDFGYTETGSIGDTVFFDVNNNGIEDSGDVGIPGVKVVLTGDVDLDGTPDTVTVTTDENGNYLFDDILPGDYVITVDESTLPDGMNQTYDPGGVTSLDGGHTQTLAAGEDIDTVDFGYTGTGTIGDTVWYDLDEDGVVDPGEDGLAGVTVTLESDLDGDGIADISLETTTDANGEYSFDNLFAGEYTITTDPSSVPGISPVYDADGVLDNSTTVTLGVGEVNNDVDFGYKPPAVPSPVISPEAPTPEVVTSYDPLFRSYVGDGEVRDVDEFVEMRRDEPVFQEPLLPVSPIYTGHAEPGTTLRINLSDSQGNFVGSQLVMADTAGNWLANFSGTLLYDMPHKIEIDQDMSLYNASSPGGFNLRTYFMPAISASPFTRLEMSVESIFATRPFAIMEVLGEHFNQESHLGWNDYYDYESVAVSTNPSQSTL